jgi:hypothetical protein
MARYMRRGITRFYWLSTIASGTLAPTVAEVTAGVRVDTQLAEVNGFTWTNNPIDTPVFSSRYTSQITGEDTAEDSNMTFYQLRGETDTIRLALAKDEEGFLVAFYEGPAGANVAAADKIDVWPAVISSNAKQYTADNEAAKYQVVFSNTAAPAEDIAVLA